MTFIKLRWPKDLTSQLEYIILDDYYEAYSGRSLGGLKFTPDFDTADGVRAWVAENHPGFKEVSP